ncbi:MAG TPA: hypothetical protein VF979_10720 [Streptosporangiaceae bacterium]
MAATGHLSRNYRSLSGISCVSKSFCLAVGNGTLADQGPTFSQVWNGQTWRTVPVPSPGLGSGLVAVSCASTSNCLAIGSANGTGAQLNEAWNGRTWRMLPGGDLSGISILAGVACPAVNSCIAVGTELTPGPSALAQAWNGKSWSDIEPARPTDAKGFTFSAISCARPASHAKPPGHASCMAVGQWFDFQDLSEHPLAESWNGTSWTLLPDAPDLTGFNAVSCPTSTTCVAVGSGPTPVTTMASAVWNGSTWSTPIVQNPGSGSPMSAFPRLTGVSCTSATNCVTVGSGAQPGTGGPFAERWTGGSSWKVLPVPDPTTFTFTPVSEPASPYGFAGVSCSAAANCIAVGGSGDAGALSSFASFAVGWNGQTWRVLPTGHVDGLMGVSCGGPSHCLTTGGYLDPADVTRTLAQSWNGKSARLASPHSLGGVLGPVSCPSTTFCLTIDNSNHKSAIWNGKRWTWTPIGQNLLITVASCASKNFCMTGVAETSLGLRWNGKTWSDASFATVQDDNTSTSLNGLSCPRPNFCMSTGSWEQDDETGGTGGPAAEVWNGTRWKLIGPPSTGRRAALGPVSCSAPTNCMTIGFRAGRARFAAQWNGHGWRVRNLPDRFPSGIGEQPSALSCPTATSCLAVGTAAAFAWSGRT